MALTLGGSTATLDPFPNNSTNSQICNSRECCKYPVYMEREREKERRSQNLDASTVLDFILTIDMPWLQWCYKTAIVLP